MKHLNKVAVLGAGVMGSALACHAANAGLQVLLMDIVDPSIEGHENSTHEQRNTRTALALKKCIKSSPAPLFSSKYADRIEIGNLNDDLHRIAECDWILEVVVERLDIKQNLYERIEQFRRPGTIITTNTSGIPIYQLAAGRSEDFRRCFFGTHFFNPPRYLELLEIVPGVDTDWTLIEQFSEFGGSRLGKTIVLCKDTPAFIANRIGVFAMAYIYSIAASSGLSLATIDLLTGPILSRPKTGTFRLGDLVGLDVAMHVVKGVRANCPDDEMIQDLQEPAFLSFLIESGYLGNKSGQGFFKRTNEKDEKGRTMIQELDLHTHEYKTSTRDELASLAQAKQIDDPKKRIKTIFHHEDAGGQLIRQSLLALFVYSSRRIPEISEEFVQVDDAMKAGFGWMHGPFELWDIIGVDEIIALSDQTDVTIADWVRTARAQGMTSFYRWMNGKKEYWSVAQNRYELVPEHTSVIHLISNEQQPPVLKNDEMVVHDIGDGVLCLEFKSKMNAIGEGILRGIQDTIDLAEDQGWNGLVIGNHAEHFTVGANIMMLGMLAFQQQFDMINMAVKGFQDTTMRCRYSDIPVVAATQGYVFGGGCEISMHCDGVAAAAESYIGLVEVGVGLLPGGGGTKEFAVRISDAFHQGDTEIPVLIEGFKTLATGQVSKSAVEAFDLGYLIPRKDEVVMKKDRNIGRAKQLVLELAPNYQRSIPRTDIKVLGRAGLGALYTAANELFRAGWASEHDVKIAHKIAYVLCGGDLSESQKVSENYLLELEREAFLSLCTEQKTMERIQHMLETGKPLRN